MKTLSEAAIKALATRSLDRARLLVKIELAGADAPDLLFGYEPEVFGGEYYTGGLLDVTPTQARLDPWTLKMRPGGVIITVANNKRFMRWERFMDLLDDFPLIYADVTITWLAGDGSANFTRFKGQCEGAIGWTEEVLRIEAIETAKALENKLPISLINPTDYPGADPDDMGQVEPIIYGQAQKVRGLAVDAGSMTTLAESIGTGNGTFQFTDVSGFPGAPGTFWVDEEQMTYSAISYANNTLTVNARGTGGTTAVEHDKGATAIEHQAGGYVYLFAGRPIHGFNGVYVDDVLADPGDYDAYTGQSIALGYPGDDYLAGYEGKAVVKFKTAYHPRTAKKIYTSELSHGGGAGTLGISRSDGRTTLKVVPDGTAISGTVTNPGNAIDQISTTTATINPTAALQICFSDYDYGTVVEQTIHVKCAGAGVGGFNISCRNDPGGSCIFSFGTACGTNWSPNPLVVGATASWETLHKSGGNWDDAIVFINSEPPGGATGLIYEVWKEVTYVPTSTITGAPSDTLSGNTAAEVAVGSVISADIDGCPDDPSGTYTGVANSLIERPDHIRKHMLIELYGLTSAEIDDDSFDEAGAQFAANSYALAVVIDREQNFTDLAAALAMQTRAAIFWSQGKEHMKWLSASPTADGDISKEAITQYEMGQTARTRIRNELRALFDKRWDKSGDEAYREVAEDSDATSQATYGIVQKTFRWDWITDSTMAAHVLAYHLSFLKDERLIIAASTFWQALKYDPADYLTFTDLPLLENFGSTPKFLVYFVNPVGTGETVNIEAVEV